MISPLDMLQNNKITLRPIRSRGAGRARLLATIVMCIMNFESSKGEFFEDPFGWTLI